ncbi:DMBT1 [Branchiostoma lanceolatum]|uniref:DMBT1 protein n=1 Tax=Branchiostoma lanceolatum TaxID=7740 RepID=A0A8J9ZTJ7_BRALA|nr:DMBT1 [Branchiostoma lanceolatum]
MLCQRRAAQVWVLLVAGSWLAAAVFGTEPSCGISTAECTCQPGQRENLTACSICTCKAVGETEVLNCLPTVDGGWSLWSEFSNCSVSCGFGLQTRSRTCDNPLPQNNGAMCEGPLSQTDSCDSGEICSGSGNIYIIWCTGNENSLFDCHEYPGFRDQNCKHGEDAGVVCGSPVTPDYFDQCHCGTNGKKRRYGRVEVNNGTSWSTVCHNKFGTEEADVVCRELGFPGSESYHPGAHWGQGTGEIGLDNVVCSGQELSLVDCACHHSPCQNNATCTDDNIQGYICTCTPGWEGEICNETDASGSPCLTQSSDCTLLTPLTPGLPQVHRCDIQTGIAERIRRLTDPLTVSLMADFILHGEARLVSCAEMSVTGYSWAIFERSANPNHVNVFAPIYGLGKLTTNKRDLTVPKQTLLPGTYMVQFQVTIVDDLLNSATDFVHQTWIQVEATPLVTTLGPSLVTQYAQGDFWVSAEASQDPDGLVSSSELHFIWTCETSGGFQASSPGRASIHASQLVVFQDNRACGLTIRCISNCDWSNTNPSEDLVLEAVPGSSDTPLYEWSVVEHPGNFGGLKTTSSEPELVIASNTFNVEGTYRLRVVNNNQVCGGGLAVSEWKFISRVRGPPALRNKTLLPPCVLERAGAGGCVCCGGQFAQLSWTRALLS